MANSSWAFCWRWLPFLLICFGPVVFLFWQTFQPLGTEGLTLDVYQEALGRSQQWTLLGNSVKVGIGVVGCCLSFGIPYGYLIGRCRLRGRWLYAGIIAVPLLIPPYVLGIAWTQVVEIGGYWAIVGILSATYLPIVAWFAARGFRDADPLQEEAALLEMGPLRAFLNTTAALARPSIFAACLLVFVLAISDFSVPDFFSFAGSQSQSFQVFSNDVYFCWTSSPRPEAAVVSAIPLMILGVLSILFLAKVEGTRSTASLTAHAPRSQPLGRQSWLAHGYLLAIVVVSVGVPLFVIVGWATKGLSFAPEIVPNQAPNPATAVLDNTTNVWTVLQSRVRGDLLRSLAYCVLAALIVIVLAIGPAQWLTRRNRSPWLLTLCLLPLAVPSVLLGMAQIRLFNRSWLDFMYTGGGLVVWTLVTRYLPIGIMGIRATWLRVHPELEEAAALSVASSGQRFRQITGPLILRGMIVTALLCFALAMRDLDSIVLLDGAQRTLPLRLYNKIHYARDAEVAALCLLQLLAIFLPLLVVALLMPKTGGHDRQSGT